MFTNFQSAFLKMAGLKVLLAAAEEVIPVLETAVFGDKKRKDRQRHWGRY